MSAKKNVPRANSVIPNKNGSSHHNVRPQAGTTARQPSSVKAKKNENDAASKVSPNSQTDARPKTCHDREKTKISQPPRPKTVDTGLARGSLKGEKHADVSIKVLECDTKNGALNNETAELEKEKVDLKRRLEEETQKVKETENKMKEIKEKNENELERLCNLLKEREESLSKAEEDKKTLQKNYNQLQHDMERELNQRKTEWDKYCKALTKKHTKEKKQLSDAIESLTVEKENLLTRLSREAADRLTHGNVNIADLSDADRPTKLQELYSELYDNEWTDAFQELTEHQKIPEKDAIKILLDILMTSFQNCREITWGRYERLINVASSIDIEQRNTLSYAKKVRSNVSEPGQTKQEAELSRAQLDKKNAKMDQNFAKEEVENINPDINAAYKDEVANENETNSPTDNNLDTTKEGTGTSRSGESKRTLVNTTKEELGMCDQKNATDEKVDPSGEKNAAKYNNVENKDEAGESNEGVGNEDVQTAVKENVDSGHQSANGESKDKFEKEGKNGATENVESGDPNVNGASKDKSENDEGKDDAKENVDSGDPNVNGTSKDKSENEKGKNGATENLESGDPNVHGASKDKSENVEGKNDAKEHVESVDPNVNGASKDKSENETGKRIKCTIDLSFNLVHEIKGIWRKTCLELKEISSEQIYSVIDICLDMPDSLMPMTSKYLKSCIDLCWKMGVQEKPLHLDSMSELDACVGKRFDKDKFRAYTYSGRIVAFVVWPSLYLHEGGPMLVKGIAQGC